MAAATRDHRLETRTARLKLKLSHEPYWVSLGRGIQLGYRRGQKRGRWYLRVRDGGAYRKLALGEADDHLEADGERVLTYFQAHGVARARSQALAQEGSILTVADAVAEYREWFVANRRGLDAFDSVVRRHILPALGGVRLDELDTAMLRRWLHGLATPQIQTKLRVPIDGSPEKAGPSRARSKSTANRILTTLKAVLNRAWQDGHVASDTAWRRLKPFQGAGKARVHFLTSDQCAALVHACDPGFRRLVVGALVTGCRLGELVAMRVRDFEPSAGLLHIRTSKNGLARVAYLHATSIEFVRRLVWGRKPDEPLFLRSDGRAWRRSEQRRPMLRACERAGITPAISFHGLRHTYASRMALSGVPLQVIAAALGHRDGRITERHYAHLTPSHIEREVRAVPPPISVGTTEMTRIV